MPRNSIEFNPPVVAIVSREEKPTQNRPKTDPKPTQKRLAERGGGKGREGGAGAPSKKHSGTSQTAHAG
jgi:hypothetical protein